ncbi:MAG: hypothetical protein AB3N63_04330 [Puniceicoccaceae bacterium]
MKIVSVFLFFLITCVLATASEVLQLSNAKLDIRINKKGGAISSCILTGNDLNPFSWQSGNPVDGSNNEGLFVCFDRLGRPSEAEMARGVPFHGEATSVEWEVLTRFTDADGNHHLKMRCILPVARMQLIREYCLYKDSTVCRIVDRIKNLNTFDKDYNIVQHPSLAPPFLDKSVMVDSNGGKGFLNMKNLDDAPGTENHWPEVVYENEVINLRSISDGNSFVANYLCPNTYSHGWGSVSNPGKGLMVGFLWPREDYPWIRIWRAFKNDSPSALGVEFGTTPLGAPLKEIRKKGDLLGESTIETLRPGEISEKTFYLFLSPIHGDFEGVEEVRLNSSGLSMQEIGGHSPVNLWVN